MTNFSFKKEDRILKRKDFLFLSKNGKQTYSKFFIIQSSYSEDKKRRLGITVSKKVGKAVLRNKIKRLIREFFRLNKEKIKENIDINIIVRKNFTNDIINLKNINEHLQKIFNEAKVLI